MIYKFQKPLLFISILTIQACQLFEKESKYELLLKDDFRAEELLWESINADYDYFQYVYPHHCT